jgi:hypothetical protein
MRVFTPYRGLDVPSVLNLKSNFQSIAGLAQVSKKKIRLGESVSRAESPLRRMDSSVIHRLVNLREDVEFQAKRRKVLKKFLAKAGQMRAERYANGRQVYTSVKIDIDQQAIVAMRKRPDGKFSGKVVITE